MARRVLDRYLDSKDARRRLAPRAKPYFRTIERGLHLGYRRLVNGAAGPWIARHYRGDRRYEEEQSAMPTTCPTPTAWRSRRRVARPRPCRQS